MPNLKPLITLLSSSIFSAILLTSTVQAAGDTIPVNVMNFVDAKTSVQFDRVITRAGGVNLWGHIRSPMPIDQQRLRRMNRDTIYSSVVVDISKGASLTLPDAGKRYMSATVTNEHNYINNIFHGSGDFNLDLLSFKTNFVMVTVRILVDSTDPEDIKQANHLQDKLRVNSAVSGNYTHPNYDMSSLKATAKSLIQLATGLTDTKAAFGKQEDVNPVKHMLTSAYGWGGLPEQEAYYINVQPSLPIGAYSLSIRDVPVDGFWSISVYNKNGFFEPNDYQSYSINNLTAKKNSDNSITVSFGGQPDSINYIPIVDGWNYVVRLYQPREEVLDGSWTFPSLSN
jgi:hypothetical protein